ncbi:His-Xaa-Ser system protein HxsD [Singulisphaera sp. PoT]|uniref:His-Xaa-Ser system protein HxsD n=1 Tax=Singulisphaera sp. PoT TaxID=3411797 RepID=UPI003BF5EA47
MPDVTVIVDPRIHRLSAVKKAAYRVGDRCFVKLEALADGGMRVGLTAKSRDFDPAALEGDFLNELLDQDLREAIAEETQGVRNLLMAQAFSGLAGEADTADFRDDPLDIGRSQGPVR